MVLKCSKKLDHKLNRMAFITMFHLVLVWSKMRHSNGSSINRSPGLVFFLIKKKLFLWDFKYVRMPGIFFRNTFQFCFLFFSNPWAKILFLVKQRTNLSRGFFSLLYNHVPNQSLGIVSLVHHNPTNLLGKTIIKI